MQTRDRVEGDFSHVRPLLLDMAQERSVANVLRLLTERLARVDSIALARVWLRDPGDGCPRCGDGAAPDVLHCVAAAAGPLLAARLPAERLTGDHAPLPARDTARRGSVLDLAVPREVPPSLAWARELGCGGAARQPLVDRDEVLGAVELLTWPGVAPDGPGWLRVIADHAAAAIAHSRAFAEIERLQRRLAQENARLHEEIAAMREDGELVGESAALDRIREQIALVAPADTRVLIQGESGTGKELVAREIHRHSARAAAPLIRVNCASIPSSLYESEFFGHVRGAFTGAVRDRAGRFELADGGTIFLDEIGELPPDVQAKLLRVLQEHQYERVGDSRTRQVDVRVIAATNRELELEVADGRFRRDLYYRLNVFPIEVPPLRERPEDVARLAEHFALAACRRLGRRSPRLDATALERLVAYDWPGNVRELQNVIERAVLLCDGGTLRFDFLRRRDPRPDEPGAGERLLSQAELRELERRNLDLALRRAGGKVFGPGGAAELLAMNPSTLASRLRRAGLQRRPATAP